MQLHLESAELKLLADALLEQDQQKYADLVNRVLAHDLRFDTDDLEQTAALLTSCEQDLKCQIDREENPYQKGCLQRRLALLERVLERINEACVMF